MPGDKKLKIFCGTPSYMSPEIVSKIEYSGLKADIWALGILMYVMLCGKFPFKASNDQDLYRKIKKGKYDLPISLSQPSKNLLLKILRCDPKDRITAE